MHACIHACIHTYIHTSEFEQGMSLSATQYSQADEEGTADGTQENTLSALSDQEPYLTESDDEQGESVNQTNTQP